MRKARTGRAPGAKPARLICLHTSLFSPDFTAFLCSFALKPGSRPAPPSRRQLPIYTHTTKVLWLFPDFPENTVPKSPSPHQAREGTATSSPEAPSRQAPPPGLGSLRPAVTSNEAAPSGASPSPGHSGQPVQNNLFLLLGKILCISFPLMKSSDGKKETFPR